MNEDDEVGSLLADIGPPEMEESEERESEPPPSARSAACREAARAIIDAAKTNDVNGVAAALEMLLDME